MCGSNATREIKAFCLAELTYLLTFQPRSRRVVVFHPVWLLMLAHEGNITSVHYSSGLLLYGLISNSKLLSYRKRSAECVENSGVSVQHEKLIPVQMFTGYPSLYLILKVLLCIHV